MSKRIPRSVRRWVWAIALGISGVPSAGAVVTLPDSIFQESVAGSLGPEPLGDDAAPDSLSVNYQVPGWASIVGSASTLGGTDPRADIELRLASEISQFNAVRGLAGAFVRYYWTVEQTGGDPFTGKVPVDITTHGRVDSAVETFAGGVDNLYVEAYFNMANDPDRIFQANACLTLCQTGVFRFDESFTVNATPGLSNRVQLTASGSGGILDIGSFWFEASVDPRIEIRSDFARRDDFRLVFSQHVEAIPEPGSVALMAAGLAVLGAALRRRHATARVRR